MDIFFHPNLYIWIVQFDRKHEKTLTELPERKKKQTTKSKLMNLCGVDNNLIFFHSGFDLTYSISLLVSLAPS